MQTEEHALLVKGAFPSCFWLKKKTRTNKLFGEDNNDPGRIDDAVVGSKGDAGIQGAKAAIIMKRQ